MASSLEEKLKLLNKGISDLKESNKSPKPMSGANALKNKMDALKPMNSGIHKPVANLQLRKKSMDWRGALLKRVMSIVEKHAGITLNNSHEEKLLRQIDKLTDQSELEQWVSSLEVMGNRHGDLQALIEYLTVHETYFYRDPQQFNGVREEVFPEIFKRKLSGQKKIKVWSAACSSGEEPYTLIILLLDELIKKSYASEKSGGIVTDWSIDVLGTDISSKIIQTASRGLYSGGPLGSFRGMPKALMRFFSEGEKNANNKLAFINYTVKPFVKKLARFKLFNLTSNRPPETGFDIVFCRNVMIYFNDDVKKQVQKTLYDALGPGGALVLGPTDILMIPELFTLHRRRGYTYYVKK